MKRVRVIPVLNIHNGGLVKSVRFKNYQYVGDPMNAVKIFNDKEVDELAIVDITATKNRRAPDIKKIREIASEAFMPVAYGGGVTSSIQVVELIANGVEKVILNNVVHQDPNVVTESAMKVGSQSVVVSMDVRKDWLGRERVFLQNGSENTGIDPVTYARQAEQLGAGEIVLNSIDLDGTYKGYDLDLISRVSSSVNVPVIALGGAGSVGDFLAAVGSGASAVAAGSMFVFRRPHQAVLISYPDQSELSDQLYKKIR
jgi:cyclase